MNEFPPPFEPEGSKPTPSAPKDEHSPNPPSFRAMFGLGIGLISASALICFLSQSPMPFLFGGIGAFVSLFFKGYRGIFVGYISTLGLVLLATVIYCANHPLGGNGNF